MRFILDMLNSAMCTIFIIINTTFWGIISLTSIIYNPKGDVANFCMRAWSKTSLWFCRVKIFAEGMENIDPGKVQIFASNHASHFDIFILSAILPRFGWVAKKELSMVPFIGWHLRLTGHVFIDRRHRDKAIQSLNEAAEKIRKGSRIMIFPEGTRSRKGVMQPFKKGLFHLCIKTGVPIVPIYMEGSYNVLKPESIIIRPGSVYVNVGKELQTTGHTDDKIEIIMNVLRERIVELHKGIEDLKKRAG